MWVQSLIRGQDPQATQCGRKGNELGRRSDPTVVGAALGTISVVTGCRRWPPGGPAVPQGGGGAAGTVRSPHAARSLARMDPEGRGGLPRPGAAARPQQGPRPAPPGSASELSYCWEVTTGAAAFWFCFVFFLIIFSFMIKGIHAYFREFRRY